MNGRNLLFLMGLLFASVIGKAQTSLPLPYYVDWTDDLNDGWQVFVKADGAPSFSWVYNQWATRTCYCGESAVFGPITYINDWTVSPAINLSSGANISFSYRVGSDLSLPISPGDTAQLYVLTGNADPALATKYLIANIDGSDDLTTKDTSVYIPPASTISYLAFRYTATTDSDFWENITKVHVTAVPASVNSVNEQGRPLTVYPNPVIDRINWNAPTNTIPKGIMAAITDAAGRIIMTMDAAQGHADVGSLPKGVYMLKMGNEALSFIKQ